MLRVAYIKGKSKQRKMRTQETLKNWQVILMIAGLIVSVAIGIVTTV